MNRVYLGIVFVVGVVAYSTPSFAQLSNNVTVFAAGLDNPRGLDFHGAQLYVAEAGLGGSNSTQGQCEQAPPPLGPITGGYTGRVSKINPVGHRRTLIDDLPSSQTQFGDIMGATDIEFVGSQLYILIAAGCSKGVPEVPNSVARRQGKRYQVIADLSEYIINHPQDFPPDSDEDPEGNPYSFKATSSGELVVVDANRSTVDKVAPDGSITRVADLAAFAQEYDTPVAIDIDAQGNIYVGSFGAFPFAAGSSDIYKITPSGQISVFATGFSTLIDIAFDDDGVLYVLETSAGSNGGPPFMPRDTGRVKRLVHGSVEVVATGLDLPTAMTFGPDGYLYVANRGHGVTPGQGEIVRIDVHPELDSGH